MRGPDLPGYGVAETPQDLEPRRCAVCFQGFVPDTPSGKLCEECRQMAREMKSEFLADAERE